MRAGHAPLFYDLDYAVLQEVIATSWLPVGDKRRFDNGTPAQLSRTMRHAWKTNPPDWRTKEDIERLLLVLENIIEHKGGLVPDFEMHVAGCSKRKRSLKEANAAGARSYQPSAETAKLAAKRQKELRAKAEELARA